MVYAHFRETGVRAGVPRMMIKLTWEMHPEYWTLPEDEDYIMQQVWEYAMKHMPPDRIAQMRRLDEQHVSDAILERMAFAWLDDHFVQDLLRPTEQGEREGGAA